MASAHVLLVISPLALVFSCALERDNPYDRKGVNHDWVTIPAGTFMMGSPKTDVCRYSDEPEQISVALSNGVEMQSTEVTQDQFYSVMGYNPSLFSSCGGTCPVERVSWHEAVAYCNALSARKGLPRCYVDNATNGPCAGDSSCGPGEVCSNNRCIKYVVALEYSGSKIYTCKGFRLPTEAEWEYACRAGTTTAFYSGANDQSPCFSCSSNPNADSIAWYCYNSGHTTHPVAGKTANAWGLYDMAGNVWEWCHDLYQSDLGSSAQTDPVGTGSSARVLRGGSWYDFPDYLRAAIRYNFTPTFRLNSFGFRCSRTK